MNHETYLRKMFVANTSHEQDFLSIWSKLLSPEKFDRLINSRGYQFYELIFRNIKEEDFRCLYSEKLSAPNSPVNCLVGAMLLCHYRNWSHEELVDQIDFNVSTRVALGLKDLEYRPFCARTLYNFKNRLSSYSQQTGVNLLEKVFEDLTAEQLAKLPIKTSIQRADSVLLNSNIQSYSRLSLLVEVLRRLYYILSEEDQRHYHIYFKPYLQGGEKYMYSLKKEEGQTRLEYISTIYYTLHRMLGDNYKETQIYQVFERVYIEHFKEVQTTDKFPIQIRPQKELGSNILQSPDDLEATYRNKRKESYQGFVVYGAETCHPDNELNLVTSLDVSTNNTDDSVILEDKIDQMKETTPDLVELHTDGGFPSKGVDVKAEKHNINLIQTAVKGTTPKVPIAVQGNEEEGFTIDCPNQEHPPVMAKKAKKNWMADFQLEICQQCPFFDQCPTKRERKYKKGTAILRFKATESLKQKRHKAIQKIPPERQTLRPGVEKLMGLMRRGEKNTGKMKFRGRFNFELYTFSMGIVINFERIFKYLKAKNELFFAFSSSLGSRNVSCQTTFNNVLVILFFSKYLKRI